MLWGCKAVTARGNDRAIIRVQRFTAAYHGSVVIDDISLSLSREVFAILGGSGSGKHLAETHDRPLPTSGRRI